VLALVALVAVLAAAAGYLWLRPPPRMAVLIPHGEPELVVMDFAAPMPLDPLPPGWWHRRFWTRAPMEMRFAVKDGVPALRLATHASASMLFRHVDVAVDDYPLLAWRWYIEQPIASERDERTREGDDHPARLYLAFVTQTGEERRMEIIWGNRLHAGDIKVIGTFPHYVANGGDENIGRWFAEEVDLRSLARRFWPDVTVVRLIDIALFCDSDDTGSASVSYFADVRLRRRAR
jgi:hypothetical protein